MFSKLFGKSKEKPAQSLVPEIMGLRLGGAFNLDELRMRLIEPKLTVEGVARTQFIQAVGRVVMDDDSVILRFYTDDDGFLQVVLSGGESEENITNVQLWYFYDTQGIGSQRDWDQLLKSSVSQESFSLEGEQFSRLWTSTGSESPPVAMTETTYMEKGKTSETDQFVMLYERVIEDGLVEYAMISAEEKIIDNNYDRCVVKSTGFDLMVSDIDIVG